MNHDDRLKRLAQHTDCLAKNLTGIKKMLEWMESDIEKLWSDIMSLRTKPILSDSRSPHNRGIGD